MKKILREDHESTLRWQLENRFMAILSTSTTSSSQLNTSAMATTTSANDADFLQCSTADIKFKAALAILSAVVLLACLIALFFYCIQRLSGGKISII
jgi:hypothetical protein